MSLRLAVSMSVVQTAVSVVLSLFSIKVTSIYLGPAGLGTLGQLNYFIAITQALLAAGLSTGLVRRLSELADDQSGRETAVSTVLRTLLVASIPASLFIALGSGWLALELLHDSDLQPPIFVFAVTLLCGLATSVIMSCANGARDFRSMALINVGSGVSSFLMILILCPTLQLEGALVAAALLPFVTWVIAWCTARRHSWWPKRSLSHGFSTREAKQAATFVPLAVIAAVGLPLVQLLIRDTLIAHSGMTPVGLLQGVIRISDMYVGVATWVAMMYFFPRFSEIQSAGELTQEIYRGLRVIVPAVALASLCIFLLREWVVRWVFSAEFLPMIDLFGWQMVGNTLKAVGVLFGAVLLAKCSAFAVAAFEIAALLLWWKCSVYFISHSGAVGATQAYAFTYAIYGIATIIGALLVIRRMRTMERSRKQ